jgi:hypothetical protein
MNSREFFYLVAQMRQAQREYLKERSQIKLRACKALESECDREILRVKQILIEEERSESEYNN